MTGRWWGPGRQCPTLVATYAFRIWKCVSPHVQRAGGSSVCALSSSRRKLWWCCLGPSAGSLILPPPPTYQLRADYLRVGVEAPTWISVSCGGVRGPLATRRPPGRVGRPFGTAGVERNSWPTPMRFSVEGPMVACNCYAKQRYRGAKHMAVGRLQSVHAIY